MKINCIGALYLNRKNALKIIKKINKGVLIAEHSGKVSFLKWRNKKNDTMISTYHAD
jgi:hypothetical protein